MGTCAVALACGSGSSGGLPASGMDVSCSAGTYILDGGCVPLPSFSDAAAEPDGDDATSITDSSDDAGEAAPTPDSGSLDPLAECPPGGNAFYMQESSGVAGAAPEILAYTGSDATFMTAAPPVLEVTITPTTGSSSFEPVQVEILSESIEDGAVALVVPGAGAYPAARSSSDFDFSLTVGDISVTYSYGAVVIDDVQLVEAADGGPARLHSLLLSYDLGGDDQTFTGCLRYTDTSIEADGD